MPIPSALSPTLRCAGSTMNTNVPQPITCSAMIIANIDPSRSHSSGVNAPRRRDSDDHCLLSGSAAMSCPIRRKTPTAGQPKPRVNVMRTIRNNSANLSHVRGLTVEADQRDRHLDRGGRAMEADQVSHFGWLVIGGQPRRMADAGDDDVADPG